MRPAHPNSATGRRLATVIGAVCAIAALGMPAGAEAVIGGTPAPPGAYPFIAAVLDDTAPVDPAVATDYDRHICGGSLIAPTIVLTAAHCVVDEQSGAVAEPGRFHVVIGRTDLAATGGERLDVQRVVVDPSYTPKRIAPDLALLQLSSPSAAPPIALGDARAGLKEGQNATAIGWGRTASGAYPRRLLRARLPLWSSARCGAFWKTLHVPGYMLCASSPFGGADACSGDSGGPLVVPGAQGGVRLFGVVSFGAARCGLPGVPGVFAWVASPYLRTWVLRRAAAIASGSTDETRPEVAALSVVGGTVRYTLSEDAELVVQIVRIHGTQRTILSTALVQQGHAGAGGFRMPRALRGHSLTPGRYLLRVVAHDQAGNRSTTVTTRVVVN